MEQGTPLTVNVTGMKLAVEDERVKPRSISEPPATRLSQLSLAVPEKVPATRPVSCKRAEGRRGRGEASSGAFIQLHEAPTLH